MECLKEINVDGKDVRLVSNIQYIWNHKLLSTNRYKERGSNEDVSFLHVFNLYREKIIKKIGEMPQLNINETAINNIIYANDTVLMAKDLQKVVTRIDNKSQKYGLERQYRKTNCDRFLF